MKYARCALRFVSILQNLRENINGTQIRTNLEELRCRSDACCRFAVRLNSLNLAREYKMARRLGRIWKNYAVALMHAVALRFVSIL